MNRKHDLTRIVELADIYDTARDAKTEYRAKSQICRLIARHTQHYPGIAIIYGNEGKMYVAALEDNGEQRTPYLQRVLSEREFPSDRMVGIHDGVVYHKNVHLISRTYNQNPWYPSDLKFNRFLVEFKAVPRGARRYLVNHPEQMNPEEKRRIIGTFDFRPRGYTSQCDYNELIPFIFETRVLPTEPYIGLETIMIEQILSLFQAASEGNIEALVRGEFIPREAGIDVYGIHFPGGKIMVHGINVLGNYLRWAHDEKKMF